MSLRLSIPHSCHSACSFICAYVGCVVCPIIFHYFMSSSISVLRSETHPVAIPACPDRESRSQIISEHLIPHIIRCHFISSRLGNHEGQAERDDRSWRQRPTRRSTLPARGRTAKRRRPRRKKRLQSNQRRGLRVSNSSSRQRRACVHRFLPVLALELMLPREMQLARDHRLLRVHRCRTPRVKRLSTIVRSTSLSSRAANGSTLRR